MSEYNRALFENMASFVDVVWEIDLKTATVCIMKDKLTPQLTGRELSLDEIMAHVLEGASPEGRQTLIDTINVDFISSLKESYEYTTRTLVVDRYHSFKCVITPMLNEYGVAEVAYLSLMDIQSILDGQKMQRQNKELDRYLSSISCGIIQYTKYSKKIVYANDTALKILGYGSIAEMQDDKFDGVVKTVYAEDSLKIRELIQNIKSENEVVECEYRVRHKDGSEVICIGNIRMLFVSDDEPIIQRSMIDVTNLRRTGQLYRETTDALAIAKMGTWSFVIGNGEPKLYMDSVVADLVGCGRHISPEEAFKFWHKRIRPEYLGVLKELAETVQYGEQAEAIYLYNHPRFGKMTIRCGGLLDANYVGDGTMIRGYHQDISEYNKMLLDLDE